MAEQENEAVAQGPFISQRHRLETITAKPTANYMGAGICAIIALLVYGLIVAMQWMDYTAFQGQ